MLEVSNVSKIYKTAKGRICALERISFNVEKGERIGVFGHAASGKSTLIRLLGGVELPTTGKIVRRMSVSWPVGLRGCFQPKLTGYQNIHFFANIYGRGDAELTEAIRDISELGHRLSDPVGTYSAVMRAKLSFALSLAVEFDCYLIDGAVGAGDRKFLQKCRRWLLETHSDKSLVLASNKPRLIQQFCDRVILLTSGRMVESLPVQKGWQQTAIKLLQNPTDDGNLHGDDRLFKLSDRR